MKKQILGVLLLAACGGDSSGPDSTIPAQLVAEWVAEPACAPPCAFTIRWAENPTIGLEAITALGLTVRVRVTADGRFTRSGTGEAAEGTVRMVDGALVVTDTRGVVDTIDYEIQGEYLHLDFRREYVELDFDSDGAADPARVSGVFRKRP